MGVILIIIIYFLLVSDNARFPFLALLRVRRFFGRESFRRHIAIANSNRLVINTLAKPVESNNATPPERHASTMPPPLRQRQRF